MSTTNCLSRISRTDTLAPRSALGVLRRTIVVRAKCRGQIDDKTNAFVSVVDGSPLATEAMQELAHLMQLG